MSRITNAAKATVISQVFRFSGLGLSFVTVPLYLAWLGRDRYGLLLTATSLTSMLMLSNGGVNWASMLLISQAHGRGDRRSIQAIVRNSFSLNLVLSGLVAVLVAFALAWQRSGHALPLVPEHPEMNDILVVLGATVIYRFMISPVSGVFIGLQQLSTESTLQGLSATLGSLAGLAIAATGGSIAHILWAQLAGAVLLGVWSLVVCGRRNTWAFELGPLWEREHVRQLFRSAVKSLTMQAGVVLWSSAPVLVLSNTVGPGAVPLFTVPNTLLGVPFGMLASFNGSLQAAYGEALGQGDFAWIRSTIGYLSRQTLIVALTVGAWFLLLAGPFVELWTGGKLVIPEGYLISTLLGFLASAPLLVFRGALAGMNRHRVAAVGDLASGGLAFALAWAVVTTTGPDWIGLAPALAALPLWWLFPAQLDASTRPLPRGAILGKIGLVAGGALAVGAVAKMIWLPAAPTWPGLTATGACVLVATFGLGFVFLAEDFRAFYDWVRGVRRRWTRSL